jgi:ubiquinone/menaquinone biosynthesis C-methylase UbiE
MPSNYDNAARFYDRLSRIVFGDTLVKAQVYLFKYIQPSAHILIIGGGTGWILEELAHIHPSGLQITYIEISSKMIALSQKRNIGDNKVIFINEAIENIPGLGEFDVVITPFLFDNFTEQTVGKVFGNINNQLKSKGIWLNTDFQLTGKRWQVVLLKTMLLFFKLCCGIESSKLTDVEKYFEHAGYQATAEKTFFGDFIMSKAYRKSEL